MSVFVVIFWDAQGTFWGRSDNNGHERSNQSVLEFLSQNFIFDGVRNNQFTFVEVRPEDR
jgi:hypothetical protein